MEGVKVEFKEGQVVWTKEGVALTIDCISGEWAYCFAHAEYCDSEGETWTDVSNLMVRKRLGELLHEEPKAAVPKYLQTNIDNAEKNLKMLREQGVKLRTENAELQEEQWKVKADMRKYPAHVVRQLELFEKHLAGDDLLVCWEQYGRVTMKRMSELTDGDGDLRMVSLLGKYGTSGANRWIKHYDWTVHQYSDDSGSKFRALVAGDEKEMLVRIREFLDALRKDGLNVDVRTLRAYKELGVELDEKELKMVAESDAAQKKQEKETREREKKRVREQAEKLGLKISE